MPMFFKRVLFRLHRIIGISAALVLGVVGFTSGLLGFEQPALVAINPQLRIAAADRLALAPDKWVASARAAYPGYAPRSIAWTGGGTAAMLPMARAGTRVSADIAVDPYSGEVLGTPRGAGFFKSAEQLHRTLAAGPAGKQIVGAITALLVVLVVSGRYLRWPRRPRSWAAWLHPDLTRKGRGLLWNVHAVGGTWLLAFYMVAALTGLWWSYGFYLHAVNQMAGGDDIATPWRSAGRGRECHAGSGKSRMGYVPIAGPRCDTGDAGAVGQRGSAACEALPDRGKSAPARVEYAARRRHLR